MNEARGTSLPFAQTLRSTATMMVRALREDARHVRYHLARLAFVLFALAYLIIAHRDALSRGAPGLEFFRSITWLNLIGITVAGFGFFASAITEEKEEMTLGLLRMAGISPIALLLGKSTARLASAAMLLSVQFPFTWLAITLGGVTWHQVIAAYCGLLAYMVLLANLALFFSVICNTTSRAGWMTGCAVGFYFMLADASYDLAITAPPAHLGTWYVRCLESLGATSLYTHLGSLTSTGFAAPAISLQVTSNLVAAGVLFLLSWLLFEAWNRDEKPVTIDGWRLLRRDKRILGFDIRRPNWAPLIWKDFHFIAGGKPMWLVKFVAYPLLIGMVWCYYYQPLGTSRRGQLRDLGEIGLGTMGLVLLLELALVAARVFGEEAKWRTLSSLLMLPRSTGSIAYSKTTGCLLGIVPAVFYFAISAVFDPKNFETGFDELVVEQAGFMIVHLIVALHLAAFLSLYIRWAAVPAAGGIVFFSNAFCIWAFRIQPHDTGILFLFSFGGAFACVLLQFGIANRLRTLAAR